MKFLGIKMRDTNFVSFCLNFFFFLLQRFQLLYRPAIGSSQRAHRYPLPRTDRTNHATTSNRQSDSGTGSSSIPAIAVTLESNPVSLTLDDAPPKYTPPPSYTTATGARIAKLLRNSIRRSVRRYFEWVFVLFKHL